MTKLNEHRDNVANEQTISFRCLRVTQPETLVINGRQPNRDKLALSTASSTMNKEV
jgi:hypothetical protein